MFRLSQVGAERGDCTAPYDVILDKDYTLSEFLSSVLIGRPDEWGYIRIRVPDISFFDYPRCEYRHGGFLTPLRDEYLPRRVKSATADGGWTRMDYVLTLEEE